MVYDQFLIVDCPIAYNVIISRTTLTGIKGHLSPHMLLMKFLTCYGTGVIRRDQLSARTSYATTLKSAAPKPPKEALSIVRMSNGTEPLNDPRDKTPMPNAQRVEDLETVVLHENHPKRCVKIDTTLTANLRSEFIQLLRHHSEVFAWSYDDMLGISHEVIHHKFSISRAYEHVR